MRQSDYQSWLNRVFGRAIHQSAPIYPSGPEMLVDLVQTTLTRSGTDLKRFGDKQVANGLKLIFDPSHSDIVFAFGDPVVPAPARTAAVLAIKDLYAHCLNERAHPVLCHRTKQGASHLNVACYMLWDTTPIGAWGCRADCEYFDLALEVLTFALYLPNPACVESALHGLGHLGGGTAERVHRIIDDWLAHATSSGPELREYARLARSNHIV